MEHLLFVALCWGVGGFINGIAGFGAALIAMPLITTMVPLRLAVPSCTILGVTLCLQMAWTYRKNIDFEKLKPIYFWYCSRCDCRYHNDAGISGALPEIRYGYLFVYLCDVGLVF